MKPIFQQLMLPQLALGGVETVFNGLLTHSPHIAPYLRKLAGKMLEIQLKSPDLHFYILFSEMRTDWLSTYEGEIDCTVQLQANALAKLANKSQLTDLINNKTLILNGDLQVLQHFTALLEQIEKDPAQWLSLLIGDVPAQLSTDFARSLFHKFRNQFQQDSRNLVDNLTIERPVLVHRLQLADFCDQVKILEQQTARFEQRITEFTHRRSR